MSWRRRIFNNIELWARFMIWNFINTFIELAFRLFFIFFRFAFRFGFIRFSFFVILHPNFSLLNLHQRPITRILQIFLISNPININLNPLITFNRIMLTILDIIINLFFILFCEDIFFDIFILGFGLLDWIVWWLWVLELLGRLILILGWGLWRIC